MTFDELFSKSPVPLNVKQKGFLEGFISSDNHSILQGVAGSGKSTVMTLLKEWYEDEIVFFGSTGVASQNLPKGIGMGTAHSYLSLPLKPSTELDVTKISRKSRELFVKSDLVKIVVIDEAFILNSDNLDIIWKRIERFNKKTRNRKQRKIRLLLVGDSCQATTITNTEVEQELEERWGHHLMFKSDVWGRFDFNYYVFDKVERQEDKTFKACLDVIRYDQTHRFDKCLSWLNKRVNFNYPKTNIILAATNKTVDKINNKVLSENQNTKIHYKAYVKDKFNIRDTLVREDGVTLCEGLKVMTIVNDPEGRWINGSTGLVTSVDVEGAWIIFDHSGEEHYVGVHKWENKEVYIEKDVLQSDDTYKDVMKDRVIGSLMCLPVLQASSISISKSQGLTIFDDFVIDFEDSYLYTWEKLKSFGTNFVYLGLSRGVDVNKITLARPLEKGHIKCCDDSINFWHYCCERSVI